ncbi:hypothetical protein [Pediococcus damnosus]|nr:hypothetical protein [Pediococcus damnosus]
MSSCPKAQRKVVGKDGRMRVLAAELCHKNRQRMEDKRFSERKSLNAMN